VLAVTASLWLLGVAQCHTRSPRTARARAGQERVRPFLLQGPVLIALAWLLVARTRLGRIL
jgi:hypothetical protein